MIEVAWHYLGVHEASLLVQRSFMSGKNAATLRLDGNLRYVDGPIRRKSYSTYA
jgi:hypothetical protein